MRLWVVGLVLVLAACGGSGSPPSSGSAPPSGAAPWPAGGFDYQLGGAYPPPAGVSVVTRDRAAPPAAWPVCYVNAYQTQPAETAWWRAHHPDLLLPVEDPDWPGEFLLDTRQAGALAAVVGPWVAGCAAAGYRAVELDNLDSWTRSGGRLMPASALAYARLLMARAPGLSFGQKNAAELGDRGRAAGFDFAVTEECAEFAECADYTDVYGAAVLEVEYTRGGLAAACPAGHPVVLRDRDVVPAGEPGYVRATC